MADAPKIKWYEWLVAGWYVGVLCVFYILADVCALVRVGAQAVINQGKVVVKWLTKS